MNGVAGIVRSVSFEQNKMLELDAISATGIGSMSTPYIPVFESWPVPSLNLCCISSWLRHLNTLCCFSAWPMVGGSCRCYIKCDGISCAVFMTSTINWINRIDLSGRIQFDYIGSPSDSPKLSVAIIIQSQIGMLFHIHPNSYKLSPFSVVSIRKMQVCPATFLLCKAYIVTVRTLFDIFCG